MIVIMPVASSDISISSPPSQKNSRLLAQLVASITSSLETNVTIQDVCVLLEECRYGNSSKGVSDDST